MSKELSALRGTAAQEGAGELARLRQSQSDSLEGKLLPHEEAGAQWARAFAALRDRALGMADRIVAKGADRNAEELRRIVDSETRPEWWVNTLSSDATRVHS